MSPTHWILQMKKTTIKFTQRYVAGLRRHLKPGIRENLQPASKLGSEAAALGVDPLELARIHEEALAAQNTSEPRISRREKAGRYFDEALIPIVETHRAARQSKADLKRLGDSLTKRKAELAVSNRQLQRGILRRKSVEAALRKSGVRYGRLLKDSLQLQEGLRRLTHKVLAAQEEERRKISQELQNEIGQTLLGINLRLLTLRKEAKVNTAGLKNEIASMQRLVAKSVKSVRQVARKFRKA